MFQLEIITVRMKLTHIYNFNLDGVYDLSLATVLGSATGLVGGGGPIAGTADVTSLQLPPAS